MNATIADAQGVGTIVDDEPLPSLSINDVTVTETDAAGLTAVFTVSLSARQCDNGQRDLRNGKQHRHGAGRLHGGGGDCLDVHAGNGDADDRDPDRWRPRSTRTMSRSL